MVVPCSVVVALFCLSVVVVLFCLLFMCGIGTGSGSTKSSVGALATPLVAHGVLMIVLISSRLYLSFSGSRRTDLVRYMLSFVPT